MQRVRDTLGRWILPAMAVVILSGCASPHPYEETSKRHFLSLNKPAKRNPADQLTHAQSLAAAGKSSSARSAYRALVATWPGSAQAPAAQHGYAELLDQARKTDKAFEAYQDLITKYPGEFPYDAVLSSQFRIANETLARRHGSFLFFGGFRAPEKAADMFEKITRNGPRWERAPEAQFLIGRSYEINGDYELAIVAYMTCEQRYAETPYAEQAAVGRVRCWKKLADSAPNDQESLDQALASSIFYLQRFPNSDNAALVQSFRKELLERRAQMTYDHALYYDTRHKPEAALVNYREFLAQFPDSDLAPQVKARVDQLSRSPETKP